MAKQSPSFTPAASPPAAGDAAAVEREADAERRRRGVLLRHVLLLVLAGAVLGLIAGAVTGRLTGGDAAVALSGEEAACLPDGGRMVAAKPVSFDLFQRYAAAAGGDFGVKPGTADEVTGVSGLAALSFCQWLTAVHPPGNGLHYTLPEFDELRDAPGAVDGAWEWSATPEANKVGQVQIRRMGKGASDQPVVAHLAYGPPKATFRVAVKTVPAAR